MAKKRLETPSEVIFPEVKQKAQYLTRTCPDCGNERFKIVSVVRKPFGTSAGIYRVECTLCKFVEAAVSKNSYTKPQTEHKRGKVPKKPGC